jgi:glycosyltransferase involved in cell wall biosynthesis
MTEAAQTSAQTLRPSNERGPGDDEGDVAVTILLPAYNEEDAIKPVVDEVRAAMASTDHVYEILVVDDQSTDRTAARAEALGVRVIRRPLNGGSGASRKTGTLAARGEFIVMLDADGSYEPNDIPVLLDNMPAFDQVNGARTSEEGTLKFLRVPAKWLIRQFACYLAGTSIPDLNTGLKAFKRSIMLRYLWVVPDGFSCVSSMTLAFLTNGHGVKYVPTRYRRRIGKSKFHPVKDTQRYLSTVFRMVMYFRPLRVFGPAATLIFLGALAKTLHDVMVIGAGIQQSTIIIWMTGVMVLMLGLLADLIVAQKRIP